MLRIFFPLLFNTDDDKKNNYAVELIATEGSTTIVEEGHFKYFIPVNREPNCGRRPFLS